MINAEPLLKNSTTKSCAALLPTLHQETGGLLRWATIVAVTRGGLIQEVNVHSGVILRLMAIPAK
jgi:hypothetical protein